MNRITRRSAAVLAAALTAGILCTGALAADYTSCGWCTLDHDHCCDGTCTLDHDHSAHAWCTLDHDHALDGTCPNGGICHYNAGNPGGHHGGGHHGGRH